MADEELPDYFYTLLGVTRNATEDEIRATYRRLSLIYHPDKHSDPSQRAIASSIFARINRAASTLLDPTMRRLYDETGIEGVVAAQQLGPCDELESLRVAIKRLLQRKEQQSVHRWQNRSALMAGIDVSSLTEDWSPIASTMHWSDYLPRMNQIAFTHQLRGYLTPSVATNVTFKSDLANGAGTGSLIGLISWPSWSAKVRNRLEVALGESRRLAWGATMAVHRNLNLDLLLSGSLYGGMIHQSGQISASSALGAGLLLTGTVFSQGLALSIERRGRRSGKGDGGDNDNVVIPSLMRTSIIYNWMDNRVSGQGRLVLPMDRDRNLRLDLCPASVTQLVLGISSRRTKWSVALQLGSLFGVGLLFGIPFGRRWSVANASADEHVHGGGASDRDGCDEEDEGEDEDQEDDADDDDPIGQRHITLMIPIYISRELSTRSILLAIALPSLLGTLLYNLVLIPWQRATKRATWREWRSRQAHLLLARKEESEQVRTLMETFYARRLQGESPSGLVITKAIYQSAESTTAAHADGPFGPSPSIDVKIPLQMAINNSQLYIPAGISKADLLGFYNVAPGQRKILLVEYSFKGLSHRVWAQDGEALLLPQRQHLCTPSSPSPSSKVPITG